MEVSSCRRVVPFHLVLTANQASSCCRVVPFHQVPTAKQLRERKVAEHESLISTMKALSLTPFTGLLNGTEDPSIPNGPLTIIDFPSTYRPLNSTEGPSIPNGPLIIIDFPSTYRPLTSIEDPSTLNGPLRRTEGPSTPPNGLLTSTEGSSTLNGLLNSTGGPSTPNRPLTSIEGPSTPNGPLTSTEGPSTPNGTLTSTGGPSTSYEPLTGTEEEQEEVTSGPSTQDVPVPETPTAVRPAKRKRRPPPHLQDFVLGEGNARVALTITEGPSTAYRPLTSTEGPSTPNGLLTGTEEEQEEVTSGPSAQAVVEKDVPVPETPEAVRPAKRKRRPPPHLQDFVLGKGNVHVDQLVPYWTLSSLEEGLPETRKTSTPPGTPEAQRTRKRTRCPPTHLRDYFMLE